MKFRLFVTAAEGGHEHCVEAEIGRAYERWQDGCPEAVETLVELHEYLHRVHFAWRGETWWTALWTCREAIRDVLLEESMTTITGKDTWACGCGASAVVDAGRRPAGWTAIERKTHDGRVYDYTCKTCSSGRKQIRKIPDRIFSRSSASVKIVK